MRTTTVPLALAALALSCSLSGAPLPEDQGSTGLHQSLRRLGTNARVLYITAHPDDEDGGTITYLTRGLGVHVTLLSVTRGEAGANLITGDFFTGLGALRTVELLQAARYYGCSIRFTTFADYGYSKNVEEAWRNWDRQKLLKEVVDVVRLEKPHVILARWQGTARDGHGHHSAAGVMAQEAFAAAADSVRFPGEPWKTLKLYSNNRREADDWTILIDSGEVDPILGKSYAQIARDGLRWQRTQGAGAVHARPGPQVSYYRLLAGVGAGGGRESSFFAGIEDRIAPPDALARLAAQVRSAYRPEEPLASAPLLAEGLTRARQIGDPATAARWQDALNRALGLDLEAMVQPANPVSGPMSRFVPYETIRVATPGDRFGVGLRLHAAKGAVLSDVKLEIVNHKQLMIQRKSDSELDILIDPEAAPTSAHWHRARVTQLSYDISDTAKTFDPLPEMPLRARATYRFQQVEGVAETAVLASTLDTLGVQHLRPVVVGPKVSIKFSSDYGILPKVNDKYSVRVHATQIGTGARTGSVRLNLPQGWTASPESAPFSFTRDGEEAITSFTLTSQTQSDDKESIVSAYAEIGTRRFAHSFTPYSPSGLDPLYLAAPATHRIQRVPVELASNLRVGYVMGTGDEVPEALRQLGVPFEMLDTAALAQGDLSRFSTILLGIRAYAARQDVRIHNQRLLDYVAAGGVLVVQYNTPEYDRNYGPYPYTMGRNPEEVSEEDSPVTILDPTDPLLSTPNKITPADFDGWIEQRGSKFFTTWDARWKPLIETHDRGQAPQRGGWVAARHGKGLYIYCAYAWYRQLPFAVPGAVRLFANLISQGRSAGR